MQTPINVNNTASKSRCNSTSPKWRWLFFSNKSGIFWKNSGSRSREVASSRKFLCRFENRTANHSLNSNNSNRIPKMIASHTWGAAQTLRGLSGIPPRCCIRSVLHPLRGGRWPDLRGMLLGRESALREHKAILAHSARRVRAGMRLVTPALRLRQ